MRLYMKKGTADAEDVTSYVTSFQTTAEFEDDRLIGNTPCIMLDVQLLNTSGKFDGCASATFYADLNQTSGTETPTHEFTVQEAPEKYTKVLKLSLYDDMILLNQAYKSKLTYSADSSPTIQQQIAEISSLSGLSIDTSGLTSIILAKTVGWIDTAMIMRNYIGFIAELAGCNAYVGEDNKLVFKKLLYQNFDIPYASDFDKSEEITISRIAYDDGLNLYEAGDKTGKTIYLSSNNSYVDSQQIVDDLLSSYSGASFHALDGMKCFGQDGMLPGCTSTYDGIKCIITSVKRTYSGERSGVQLSGDIALKNADTVVTKIDDSVRIRRVQTQVDQINGSLTTTAEDIDGLNKRISKVEQTADSITISFDDIKSTVNDTVKSVEKYYLQNDGTTPSADDSAWNTKAPTWVNGKHMWEKQVVTYVSGETSVQIVDITGAQGPQGEKGEKGDQGIQGLQGPKGDQGIQGKTGASGKTSYFHIKYSTVSNPTSSSQMTETPSAYIGTYVDYTEADSDDPSKYTWSQFVGSQGEKGDQGIPGTNGTDGKTQYLHIAYANSADGKTGFSVSDGSGKLYIGQYTDFAKDDSTDASKYTWSKIKGETGAQGAKGDTGPQGPKGDTGKGIASSSVTYQAGSSGTVAPTGTWSETIPTVTQGNYLWSRTVTTYTDGTSSTSYSVALIPKTGATGATGTSVTSITAQFYLSTSKTAQSGGSWGTAMPTWSSGKYLWTRYQIVYSNPSSTVYTTPQCDSSWEAVNEVQVGGRNLIRNGDFTIGAAHTDFWLNWGTPTTREITKGSDGYNYMHIVTSGSKWQGYAQSGVLDIPCKAGDQFTVSFYGYSPADRTKCCFGIQYRKYGSGTNIAQMWAQFSLTTSPARYELTFTVENNSSIQRIGNLMFGDNTSDVKELYLGRFKLESGNKATDWTPAPEDVQAGIDEAKQGVTNANGRINRINDDLGTTTARVGALENSVSETADRISSAEGSIGDLQSVDSIRKGQIEELQKSLKNLKESEINNMMIDAGLGDQWLVNFKQYIKMSTKGLEIGGTGSKTKLQMKNNEIAFTYDGDIVASMSSNSLSINSGYFITLLNIGNFGFRPRKDANGNNSSLDFKKVVN